jgi:hypothetical protein
MELLFLNSLVKLLTNLEQGQSFMVEIDEQTGFQEKVISRAKKLIPTLLVYGKDGVDSFL